MRDFLVTFLMKGLELGFLHLSVHRISQQKRNAQPRARRPGGQLWWAEVWKQTQVAVALTGGSLTQEPGAASGWVTCGDLLPPGGQCGQCHCQVQPVCVCHPPPAGAGMGGCCKNLGLGRCLALGCWSWGTKPWELRVGH